MAPRPAAETRPEGLDLKWCHVWDHALKVLKEYGLWTWETRPLLDEYVYALIRAEECRLAGEDTKWDRAAKRASSLADQLALTARGRKAVGIVDEDEGAEDPFAQFAAPLKLAGS